MAKRKISTFKYDRAMEILKDALRVCVHRNVFKGREYDVLSRYYFSDKTFAEIGKEFGLTGEAVRIIFNRASRKLRSNIGNFVSLYKENIELKSDLSRMKIQNGSIPIKKELLCHFSELDLDVRTMNCLKSTDLVSLLDLVKKDEAYFFKIPKFGKSCMRNLNLALKEKNLSLGMHVYES